MNKEKLIDDLLAFIAPVINNNEEGNEDSSAEINILSKNEVQLRESSGHLPTNKVYDTNPFVHIIWRIVRYGFEEEYRHYLEELSDRGYENEAEELEINDKYNPGLLPDHIYHSLRYLENMLLCYERETGDPSFKKEVPYTADTGTFNTKPLSLRTISEIMSELEVRFRNDFQSMCDSYDQSEQSMLTLFDAKLEDDSTYVFSDIQRTLLAGLKLLNIYLTTKKYYKYLGYIIKPEYSDKDRKKLLYPIFNDIAVDKIKDINDNWEIRARIILKSTTGAHDGDIDSFVDNEWNKESSDMDNLETFLFSLSYHTSDLIEETESLENKYIHDEMNVYWKDPAGITSGYYKVDGEYEAVDNVEIDDRIIDISNLFGSQAQVYAYELFTPKK